jgi:acetyl esterase/lipase
MTMTFNSPSWRELKMKTLLLRACAVVMILACALAPLRAAEPKVQADVVYGHKDGMALTFDVISPEEPNGAGVLWIQSGGWYSTWVDVKILLPACQPYLAKGMTLFIVRHGSAPKYAIPDAVADVRRSVRFIRMKAKDWGVDPERLGVFGGSAGGHLTLMLATTGDDGDAKAKDEVLKNSNKIAAAVALYPPTDIRDWVTNPPEEIKKIAGLKPPLTFDASKTPEYSPLLHVKSTNAPILLIHGDKDLLVPIEHSLKMIEALKKEKVPSELITIEGAAHGFNAKQNKETVVRAMVSWFEKHLAAKKEP